VWAGSDNNTCATNLDPFALVASRKASVACAAVVFVGLAPELVSIFHSVTRNTSACSLSPSTSLHRSREELSRAAVVRVI